eukprot:13010666-Alexandrium_andersonii.AAC.1
MPRRGDAASAKTEGASLRKRQAKGPRCGALQAPRSPSSRAEVSNAQASPAQSRTRAPSNACATPATAASEAARSASEGGAG